VGGAQPSAQPLQRKSRTWQAAMPFPWRAIDGTQNRGRPRAYCRGAAPAVERIPKSAKFVTLSRWHVFTAGRRTGTSVSNTWPASVMGS
jgi:hypothetical protein